MQALNSLRVVLVEPTHPGNIGATARAMANMGIGNLVLVKPREFPSAAAMARAAAAAHILTAATVVDNIDQAIAKCQLVIGTTARRRELSWAELSPANAMKIAAKNLPQSQVAILFGRERSGLTNDELSRCNYLVRIDVDEKFPSINLAAAAMILLYELRRAVLNMAEINSAERTDENFASADQMQYFYMHLSRVLTLLEFGNQPTDEKLMQKLRLLFNRSRLSVNEINILRGILTAIEKRLDA